MKCPVCDESMREVEKSGVALDICPGCKGVWLDRGELEKLMEFAAATAMQETTPGAPVSRISPPPPGGRDRREYREEDRHHGHHDGDDDDDHYGYGKNRGHDDDDHRYDQRGNYGPYQKKKSWISNVFDMFGGD